MLSQAKAMVIKMKKKYLAALLSLALAASAVITSSCSSSSGEEGKEKESETQTQQEARSVTIIDGTDGDYGIIRPSIANSYELEATISVNQAFGADFKDTWDKKLDEDFIKGKKGDHVEENDNREILIGYTNRKESRDAYAALADGEYIIKLVGNKLVIIGADPYATYAASQRFISEYVTGKNTDGTLKLSEGLTITGKASMRQIDINEGASYRMLSWNLGCAVGVADDAVNVILEYLPDIVSLQESNPEIHNNVIAKLIEKYPNYAYVQRTHENSDTLCYTPILYNTKVFTLVDSGVEWLDGRFTGTNTKCLCWAVLKDTDGRTFGMINFHGAVCSNAYAGYENCTKDELKEIAAAWQLDNVRQIIDVKNAIIEKHGDIPITVGGDCNFRDDTEQYEKLTGDGFAEAEKTAGKVIKTGITTSFSYGSFYKEGKSIDHIFQKGGIDFAAFDIICEDAVASASDHCPIYVDFNIGK